MYKVKVFENNIRDFMEDDINDFLSSPRYKFIDIFIDIKYSVALTFTSFNSEIPLYSAMLIYKEIKDE